MFSFDVQDLLRAVLIFLRIGGIIFVLPIFGDAPTPVRIRTLLAGAIAFGIYPLVPSSWMPNLGTDVVTIFSMVIRELLVGLTIGFIARLAFEGILMAASMVGYQMGFGTAGLFMPDAEQTLSGFSALHRVIVMLIFLTLSLHHIFISAIFDTFILIPAGGALPKADVGMYFIKITADIFVISLQIASPIFVALLFSMAALGLIARTVPQLNVFTLSFPVSFFLGLIIYAATFALYPDWMAKHFEEQKEGLYLVMRNLGVAAF